MGSVGSTNGETLGPLSCLHQTRNKQIVGHWLILLCPYKQPDQRMWSRSNEWTHQSYDTPCGSIRENPSMPVIRTSFYRAQSFWWFLKERFKKCWYRLDFSFKHIIAHVSNTVLTKTTSENSVQWLMPFNISSFIHKKGFKSTQIHSTLVWNWYFCYWFTSSITVH